MNKVSDDFYRLTKSLSDKEASQFRRSLSVYDVAKGKNNSLILFDLLRSFATFDDAAFKKQLPKGFKHSNLSSIKTQLKNKLMDFLVMNHGSDFAQVHRRLNEIEILFQRGFYDEAYEAAQETKAHLRKAGLTTYYFVPTYFEMYLLNYRGGKDILNRIGKVSAENLEIAEHLHRTYRIAAQVNRMQMLQSKGMILRTKEDVKELADIVTETSRELIYPDLNLSQKLNLEQALARLSFMAADPQQTFVHAQNLHGIFKTLYANYKPADAERLFSIITDLLGLAFYAKEMKTYILWFKDLQMCLNDFPLSPMYAEFKMTSDYRLSALSKNDSDREQGWNALLAAYRRTTFTNTAAHKLVQTVISVEHLRRSDYEAAADSINEIIEPAQQTDYFHEQYDFLRVVRCVALYELLQSKKITFQYYSTQVNTVYQRMRKKPKYEDYRLEQTMLEFLRNVTDMMSKKEQLKRLKQLNDGLAPLFKECPLYVKQVADYFDFKAWVRKKLK